MEIAFCLIAAGVLACAAGLPFRRWRPVFLAGFAILLVSDLAIAFLAPRFPRRLATGLNNNRATTSSRPEFPELRTRIYSAPPDEVLKAAGEEIRSLPNWKFVSADPATLTLHAEKRVLIFTDDVTVHFAAAGAGTRVDVESHSRVGKGDFGENRRHIAQLFWNLDRRFSQ